MQQFLLSEEQMYNWGWRVPFMIGAVLSLIALYLRSHMDESKAFKEQVAKPGASKNGTLQELMKHPRAVVIVVGLTLGGTIAFYTYSTYMQKFLVNTVHLSKETSTIITCSTLFLCACLQPLFGILSDRIGRKPLLIGFGVLGTFATIPLLETLSHTTSPVTAFVLMMSALIIVSGYTSINAIVKAELFPTEIRALGVGFPYSITVALFGGTAEYVALWFKDIGHEPYFYFYVTICIFISLIVYIFMKDTRKRSLIQ